MIDLYFAPTPNGLKARLFLEEAQIPYRLMRVALGKGEQLRPEFLAISPNGKIPAIVDHEPAGGGDALSLFESGAILLYLADKTGRLIPADPRGRADVFQWRVWAMCARGPRAANEADTSSGVPAAIYTSRSVTNSALVWMNSKRASGLEPIRRSTEERVSSRSCSTRTCRSWRVRLSIVVSRTCA